MLDVLDKFGFVKPVHGNKADNKKDSAEVKLNKNFYPDECTCIVTDSHRIFNNCKIHMYKFGEMMITKMNEKTFQEFQSKEAEQIKMLKEGLKQ